MDEVLCQAANDKKWKLLLKRVNDQTNIDTVKHILLKAACQGSWWFVIELFKNGVDLCLAMYSHLLDILTVSQRTGFLKRVFEYAASMTDLNITVHLFLSAIEARSVRSTVAREIVRHIGMRETHTQQCRFSHLYQFFKSVHGYLCQQLSREDLEVFVCGLKNEGGGVCSYLAVLLSAHLGDWEFVNKCLKSGSLFFRAGSRYVCCLAWEKDALECAARLLWRSTVQSSEWRRDQWVVGILGKFSFSGKSNKDKLISWLSLCEELGLYDAGLYVSIWMGDLDAMLRMWTLVDKRSWCGQINGETGSVESLTEAAIAISGYPLALSLLARCTAEEQVACVKAILVQAGKYRNSRSGHFEVLKRLIRICDEKAALEEIVYHVIDTCASPRLLTLLLASEKCCAEMQVGPRRHGVFLSLIEKLGHFRFLANALCNFVSDVSFYDDFKQHSNIWSMLKLCVEAGMCSHWQEHLASGLCRVETPFEKAIKIGVYELVVLLYQAGAATNAELYKWSTHARLSSALDRSLGEDQAGKFHEFLIKAAGTPRSLTDLCRLSVSHQIGCRADRKHRALSLGLPMALTQKVLLIDFIHLPPV